VPRRTDAGGVELLLHDLLVAEGNGLGRRQTGKPEVLAKFRRQDHEGFPQAFDAIERRATMDGLHLMKDRGLVDEGGYLHVGGEALSSRCGKR
jgi:hypothetical protein